MLMHLWWYITMQGLGFALTLRPSLAISHNVVSSFPERISECRRLRYLNARYNALKEFPTPVRIIMLLQCLSVTHPFPLDPAIVFTRDSRSQQEQIEETPRRYQQAILTESLSNPTEQDREASSITWGHDQSSHAQIR